MRLVILDSSTTGAPYLLVHTGHAAMQHSHSLPLHTVRHARIRSSCSIPYSVPMLILTLMRLVGQHKNQIILRALLPLSPAAPCSIMLLLAAFPPQVREPEIERHPSCPVWPSSRRQAPPDPCLDVLSAVGHPCRPRLLGQQPALATSGDLPIVSRYQSPTESKSPGWPCKHLH